MKNHTSTAYDQSTWHQLTNKMKDADKVKENENRLLKEQIKQIFGNDNIEVSVPDSADVATFFNLSKKK